MPVVRSFLEGLERDLGPALSGLPLYEPLFQLMCHPVSVEGRGRNVKDSVGFWQAGSFYGVQVNKSHFQDPADRLLIRQQIPSPPFDPAADPFPSL